MAAATIRVPSNAAIAIPATVPRLRDDEPPEVPIADEHPLEEQVDDSEPLGVIVTMFGSAPSFHAHADTLKTPRS